MTGPPFEQVALVLSAVLVLVAPLTVVSGYRLYTAEQRAGADGIYHAYLFSAVAVSIFGTASFVWILAEGLPTVWAVTILAVAPLPVYVVQWRLHREIGYTGWLGTA